ncbi:ROK family protein [Syntrophorhabdus aromaticivorans]|uniref:ROK family protein n=1 Tax=Syntrophorhabdus aromaticivorans TaxID=328301 RepID=A0A971M6Q1_9BACT|nr:ROK family protein [Syntrophorhabdus aromaticivorans]NLW36809.1 ROK family protein [Syntrophorhabdus aromaticivorans]
MGTILIGTSGFSFQFPYAFLPTKRSFELRIGIDIGGSKIAAGLVNRQGRVVNKKRIPVEKHKAYAKIRDAIALLIEELVSANGIEKTRIEKIGIASAGQIDKETGTILFSPNLGWHNAPLRADLEKAWGVRTSIENDVNAAVYGEWRFGLLKCSRNVLGVYVGTGVGGGIIIDGKVYRGFSNVGGEVGHITLNPYGYPCNCGSTGCFEAYCGGSYIAERARQRLKGGYKGKLWDILKGNPDILHVGHIEEGYLLGDDLCETLWKEVVEYMGAALAGLVNLLNPEIIVLGGGVIYGTRRLIDEVRPVVEKRAMTPSIKGMRIVRAKLEEDAAIVGAAFIET